MTIYFYAPTVSFYDSEMGKVPEDAVEVTDAIYQRCVEARTQGKVIVANDKGFPVIEDKTPPVLPTDEQINLYLNTTQSELDRIAKSWGYDNLTAACSYANSTVPQFKADAEALIAWRDSVWTKAFELTSGTIPATLEDFLALLPPAPPKPKV